jgi:prevent-host-death family protein
MRKGSMREVGIRELKTRASEILRDVRDQGAEYIVTYRGRPVGVLQPLAAAEAVPSDARRAWDELFAVGDEIGRGWCSPLTSVELLAAMRR